MNNDAQEELYTIFNGKNGQIIPATLLSRVDVNCIFEDGRTPLLIAAEEKKLHICKSLQEHKAQVNGLVNETTVQFEASKSGCIEIVQLLLQHNANVKEQTSDKETAQHGALYEGHDEIAKLLLDAKVDVNISNEYNGQSAMHLVARDTNGQPMMQQQLENKGDVHIQDDRGYTLIHVASFQNHDHGLDIIQFLADQGANIDTQDTEGRTALHYAAQSGRIGIAEYLITKKANLDLVDRFQQTALFHAAHWGHVNMITQLITNHANIYIANKDDKTLLHIAIDANRIEALDCILHLLKNQ